MKAEWNYSNLDQEEEIPDEVEEVVEVKPKKGLVDDALEMQD